MTCDSGDVDLLGFEKNNSLKYKQNAVEQKLIEISALIEQITLTKGLENYEVLKQTYESEAIKVLRNALTVISNDVNEIQNLRKRKEYCKTKLIKREVKPNGEQANIHTLSVR